VAFVAGATTVFSLIYALSGLTGVASVPLELRVGIGAAGLLALGAVDVRARRRSTYCPLSWRRQTPKALIRRRSATVVAAVWGFDIGLAITTMRVAAITWGAILLAGLGLSVWFAGLAYGLGFALPFVVLLWTHRAGRLAFSPSPVDPGLESMLARRSALQAVSAVLLIGAGAALLGVTLAS
jgi:hypothetical protein